MRGKILVLDHDCSGDGIIDFHDIEWLYLEGDGDFRSPEVTALLDEADIIVTNPPFSLFREFLAWIVETDKMSYDWKPMLLSIYSNQRKHSYLVCALKFTNKSRGLFARFW